MTKLRSVFTTLATIAICLTFSSLAQAQATRTWVSGVGDDANPCSRTAPCKTFAGAISKTAAGGEINCLDPAGFGAVTITKSISIDCHHTLGGILAASVNGVIINALSTDKIILRGLDINGAGGAGGLDGVRFLAGGSLRVEDTTINNMTNGINIGVNQAANVEVFVTNSYIRNNSNVGIFLSNAAAGLVHTVVEDSTVDNNVFGLFGSSNTRTTVRGSTFSGNSNTGILAQVNPGATTAEINVDTCVITGNTTGLSAGASAAANLGKLKVSNSTISANGTGVNAGNGEALSFCDNKLLGNTVAGAFTGLCQNKQ